MISTESVLGTVAMPRQKLPMSKKDDSWRKKCIDGGISLSISYASSRRSTKQKKKINYDLYNGKIHKEDLEYVCNPLGIQNAEFPASIQPYDIWSPIFNLLFGEDLKRGFSFIVRAINEDAISEKEEAKKQNILSILQQVLKQALNPQPDANGNTQTPEEVLKYSNYSVEDMRETIATHILKYLRYNLNLDSVFAKGWEDTLIGAEEIYCVSEISNEPTLKRCNPLEIDVLLPHNSDIIDDAEVIVETTYMSLSKIIDCFYEELTEDEIDQLELMPNGSLGNHLNYIQDVLLLDDNTFNAHYSPLGGNSIIDSRGNYRVCKVTWKSKRKVGELTYLDELGAQQKILVDETYKLDKNDPDQSIEWLWINQYWEGYKIANLIYKGMGPKKLQFRNMDNISTCKSGYVGTIYNCNNSQSVSLMDRMIPWIYLYIIVAYRTELAMAKNLGKIALIDLSMIPDGWEPEKWMYYAQTMGFGFTDSFNESKKGQSIGKLAANMVTGNTNKSLDLETGNYIQSHISLLGFIENKISTLSGVTPQRMGEISPSELVGNVEAARVTSSNITEKWFQIHNWTKQRALDCLVEVAKEAWKDNPKKLQYVTDDMTTVFFSVDSESFCNSEYGVFVTNASKDLQALEALKTLSQTALQNDKISMSSIIDIFNSESIADISRKLKKEEADTIEREQQQQQATLQQQQQEQQQATALAKEKMDRDDYNKEQDRVVKLQVAEIAALSFDPNKDEDNNGINDVIETTNLALKERELAHKTHIENRKLAIEEKKIQAEDKRTRADQDLKEKEIKSKEKIAKMRPKSK